MNTAKKRVIYVFGRSSEFDKINTSEQIEFMKIGLTDCLITDDPMQAAIKRVRQEIRTGLPFISRIYKVFTIPVEDCCSDKQILGYINEICNTNISVILNKQITENEIPAGSEWVYNATFSQVEAVIESFQTKIINSCKTQEEKTFAISVIYNNDVKKIHIPITEKCSLKKRAPKTNFGKHAYYKDYSVFNNSFATNISAHVNPIKNTVTSLNIVQYEDTNYVISIEKLFEHCVQKIKFNKGDIQLKTYYNDNNARNRKVIRIKVNNISLNEIENYINEINNILSTLHY